MLTYVHTCDTIATIKNEHIHRLPKSLCARPPAPTDLLRHSRLLSPQPLLLVRFCSEHFNVQNSFYPHNTDEETEAQGGHEAREWQREDTGAKQCGSTVRALPAALSLNNPWKHQGTTCSVIALLLLPRCLLGKQKNCPSSSSSLPRSPNPWRARVPQGAGSVGSGRATGNSENLFSSVMRTLNKNSTG